MTQLLRRIFGIGRREADRTQTTKPPVQEGRPHLPESPPAHATPIPLPGDDTWGDRLSKTDRHFLLTPDVAAPIPKISEAAYNSRGQWEKIMAARHNLLQKRVIAYLIEPINQRLKEIEQAIEVLLEEPTWTPSWHQGTWNGEHILDIEAADVGVDLAMTLKLVGPSLDWALRIDVERVLKRRVVDPYRRAAIAATANEAPNWWAREDNWAAVIHSHAGIVAAIVDRDSGDPWEALTAAGIERYLEGGFTSDGYCLEGPVYWNYGMQAVLSWYAILGSLGAAKDQRADLSPLIRNRCLYGTHVASIDGIGPAFADSKSGDRIPATTCEVASAFLGTPLPGWTRDRRFPSLAQAVAWLLRPQSDALVERPEDGKIFKSFGRLTHRDDQGNLLELFVQATPNDDRLPHTHHDMGTWQLLKNGKPVAGDPGYPKDQNFGKRRYEKRQNRADGHPVPTLGVSRDQPLDQAINLESLSRNGAKSKSLTVTTKRWSRDFKFTDGVLMIFDGMIGPGKLVTRVCLPGNPPSAQVDFGSAGVAERALLGTYKDGRQWGVLTSAADYKIVTKVTC